MKRKTYIPWSPAEIDLIQLYFKNKWTEITLFQRLNNINSSRTYESMTRKLRRFRKGGWTRRHEDAMATLRIGYLDIEATNLKADFGIMLTWYIKKRDRKVYDYAVIKKSEIFKGVYDRRVVAELLKALDNYDIIYTHYGSDRKFDLPFIRTRALVHGMLDQVPKKREKFIRDTYPIARAKLKLHSNRLGSIAEACGIKQEKTPLKGRTWVDAMYGDKKALEYIAEHNKRDVDLLEKVHKALEPVERPVMTSI